MIEQALFTNDDGGFTYRARSSGFGDNWLPGAEQICADFGTQPSEVACPAALFALPFDRRHVVVVQVCGRGKDGLGPLAFRFLVLPKSFYAELHGDLFRVADAFPPDWEANGQLSPLVWADGPPPHRTVSDLQGVLNVPYSATLLGGSQALLDGGHVVFERTAPDERIVRSLWALLPASNRCELWPATFAFGNALGFDVIVLPRADGPEFANYVTEVQAGDYPQGRFELALQIAVESENQEDLDALFSRRSRGQTMRIGLILLALFIALPLTNLFCDPPPGEPKRIHHKDTKEDNGKEN